MKSVTIHRTSLSEAISKEMEELTKENQLLRNRIKVYKVSFDSISFAVHLSFTLVIVCYVII